MIICLQVTIRLFIHLLIPLQDWKLVNSVSASERIKLWNQFNGNMDQDTVKNEFFRKVHRRNPPFRIRQKPRIRDRVEVPPVIEFHYQNPPNLLPSLRELLRARKYDSFTDPAQPIYDDVQLLSMIDSELKAISVADEQIDKMIHVPGSADVASAEETEPASEEGSAAKPKASARGKKHKASPKKDAAAKAAKTEDTNSGAIAENVKSAMTAASDDKTEGESPRKKPKTELLEEDELELQKSKYFINFKPNKVDWQSPNTNRNMLVMLSHNLNVRISKKRN